MSKWIVANCDFFWTRVAIIEDGVLTDLYVEAGDLPEGDIYKGRVKDVLPGMDAAFLDIGLERTALIHAQDIAPYSYSFEGIELPQGWAGRERPSIADLLKPGQELIVQVMRIPFHGKGARLTTHITIPGKFVVLVPGADYIGISHKVEDRAERERLKQLGKKLKPAGYGIIIRTDAEGREEEEIKRDLDSLVRTWEEILERARREPAPVLLYREPGLLGRVVRDEFTSDVEKFVVDNKEAYLRVMEFVEALDPKLAPKVELYGGLVPIFDYYGIEEEIRKALKPRVWLKCGGYITFYQTEALTVVDVNTGRFVGTTRLSETIFQTNLEAAEEIARQLRLRDIGGIVIVDFIDMPRVKDRAKVMEVFQRALKKDKARVRIVHISPLGLVELTRKRRSPGLSEMMQEPCPRCEGRGRVPSLLATAAEVVRQLRIRASESDAPALLVIAHPQVVLALVGEQGRIAYQLEKQLNRALYVRACEEMPFEEFRIEEGEVGEIEKKASTLREGESFEVDAGSIFPTPSGGKVANIKGCLVDLPGLDGEQVQRLVVRIKRADKFMAEGEVVRAA